MGAPKLTATFPQLHLVVPRGAVKFWSGTSIGPRDNEPLIALARPIGAITVDIVALYRRTAVSDPCHGAQWERYRRLLTRPKRPFEQVICRERTTRFEPATLTLATSPPPDHRSDRQRHPARGRIRRPFRLRRPARCHGAIPRVLIDGEQSASTPSPPRPPAIRQTDLVPKSRAFYFSPLVFSPRTHRILVPVCCCSLPSGRSTPGRY